MADDAAAQLDQLYKPPHQFTVAKCLDFIDPHGGGCTELSPSATTATVGPPGSLDSAPRGAGPASCTWPRTASR
jgi:hypothetical protein